jgi:hypothetical protein
MHVQDGDFMLKGVTMTPTTSSELYPLPENQHDLRISGHLSAQSLVFE